MSQYLLKRLLLMIPTLIGITLVTYFMIKLAPGNPVSLKMQAAEGLKSEQVSAAVLEEMQKLYGLKVDLPPRYEAFVHRTVLKIYGSDPQEKPYRLRKSLVWLGENAIQYSIWVKQISQLQFGSSFKDHQPVLGKIKEALPITLTLNLLELLIVYFISIPLGIYSATHMQSSFDKFLMVLMFILYSLPSFWVATLLLQYFAGGEYFDWFPLGGFMSYEAEGKSLWFKLKDIAWHLVLPVTTMVYGSFAFLSRFSRSTMLDVIRQDYIRTAKAKGLSHSRVLWHHAFRNSLIPLITLLGTLLPALLGGSIIVEQIFSIPGMGRLAFESVLARDYPTIMAIATISAFLTLLSLLISDLAYAWVDPRINFKGQSDGSN